jgi:predicted ATPase
VGIHQLVIDDVRELFPPLRTGHEAPTNLPSPLTSFVGRESEVKQVVDVLAAHRLVTLVGTGGAGKTRLAAEAARALRGDFEDGVWFAALADLSDSTLLAKTVAQTMGRHDPLAGGATTTVQEHLARSVGHGASMLVLDNCEHLSDACADLVAYLLEHCPRLAVLATSRQALVFPVNVFLRSVPLGCPSTTTPARCRRVRPERCSSNGLAGRGPTSG